MSNFFWDQNMHCLTKNIMVLKIRSILSQKKLIKFFYLLAETDVPFLIQKFLNIFLTIKIKHITVMIVTTKS